MSKKLTTTEFAEAVNLTDIRVRQMINRGELAAEKQGRDWFIDEKFIQVILNRPEKRGRKPNREKQAA